MGMHEIPVIRRARVRAALARAVATAPYLAQDPDALTAERHAGSYTAIGMALSLAMDACDALYERACCCACRTCYCPLRRVETSPEALQATYLETYGRVWEDVPAIGTVDTRASRVSEKTVR